MKRIYLNRNDWLIEKDNVKIRGETYHYLKNVLRMKPNDIFAGFDGSGKEYLIEVSKMVKGIIYGKIIKAEKKFDIETPFDICLFQAVPKGKKMEQIVEGTAQLGVKKIYPVISKRVIVNIEDKKKKEKKIERWKKVCQQASKVSGRVIVPDVVSFMNFNDAIKIQKDIGIVFWEGESRILRDIIVEEKIKITENKKIHIFIGPEGGFDEEEISLAKENNFLISSLGKRILKVEIASIVATAIVIYEFEQILK